MTFCGRALSRKGENGDGTFNIVRNDETSSVLPLQDSSVQDCLQVEAVTVPAMTLESVISHFGFDQLDLLTMDIEGAEIAVLETSTGATLPRISQITVESHCESCYRLYGPDRVVHVARRLASLGVPQYNFGRRFTDVLLVTYARLHSSLAARASLRFSNRCYLLAEGHVSRTASFVATEPIAAAHISVFI